MFLREIQCLDSTFTEGGDFIYQKVVEKFISRQKTLFLRSYAGNLFPAYDWTGKYTEGG